MTLRGKLLLFVDAIVDEAQRNEEFRQRIEGAFGRGHAPEPMDLRSEHLRVSRRGGRRTAAIFDPIETARQSEEELRERLSHLHVEQLRDIVAQYGMEPGKLVMKWKDPKRIIERIVELALARAKKGDAFRHD